MLSLSAMCSMEDGKNMAGLLDTTSYHTDVNLREKFLAIPEVQRLHHAFAAEGIEYFLVGGAVRDLLGDCAGVKDMSRHPKNACWSSQQSITKERSKCSPSL